ncbi:MAG: hypothetical protein GWO26_30030 [Phycisphaerae bacterium]|nr:hypothetical protein [Phycisphaerae bacterium]
MTCPPNRASLLARKTRIETALDNAWTSYNSLLTNENESYTFDDGSGRQSARKRKLEELERAIDRLQNQLDNINELLDCKGGVVSLSLNRLGGRW